MGTSLKTSDINRLAAIANEQHHKGNKFSQRGMELLVKGLRCYKKSGAALLKIKAERNHGDWEPWLKKHFEGSKETAQLYMRISREWKSRLAAAVKSDEVHSLNDCMRLLRAPDGESYSIPRGTKGDAKKLLIALHSVAPGLAKKEIIEQSNHFIFQDGKISTWNDEVACEIVCAVGTPPVEGAVHGQHLLDVLGHLGSDKITMGVGKDKQELVVKTKKGNRKAFLTIAPIVKQEYVVPRPGPEAKWKKLKNPEQFWDAINVAAICAGRDYAYPQYTCVHLCPEYIEAFDGDYKACRARVRTGLDQPLLVKPGALKLLGDSPHLLSAITVTDGWVHFRDKVSGLIASARTYTAEDNNGEEFPNLDNLFKQDAVPLTLSQNKAFRAAITRAEIFAKHDDSDPGVLTVRLKRNKVTIQSKDRHGRYFEKIKATYDGEERKLPFDSKLLTEMVKRTKEFQVSEKSLIAEGDEFQFVSTFATDDGENPRKENQEVAPKA